MDEAIFPQRKIILLNGPPQSGKDTIANFVAAIGFAKHEKLSSPLKRIAPIIFPELENSKFRWMQNADSVKVKDVFGQDITTRAVQIRLSGDDPDYPGLKQMFGQKIFGRSLASRILLDASGRERFIVSDSGFIGEAEELARTFGKDNMYVIRLYRKGYDFKGDSRTYITVDNVTDNKVHDLHNYGTEFELFSHCFDIFNRWGFKYHD